jgi:SAM-dependent methyltransferase
MRRSEEIRSMLECVAPADRDAFVDRFLGLDSIPADTALPPQCVPYLPCPVDALLRLIDQVPVRESDVFVDVGCGVGRAAALVELLTGARTVGLEIQPALVETSRALAARMPLGDFTALQMDASAPGAELPAGSIYFLYCPFSGQRLAQFLANLEPHARRHSLHIACVDVTLPDRPWLELARPIDRNLAIYRTNKSGPT